ncbi:MAG: hypothetical protein IJ565_04220 [Bacilli bacterium]|nr:hypothetical protein [Bacilli bacterium]
MNYIKKHKKGLLIIGAIVLIVVLFLAFIHTLMPDTRKSVWGNRINDIENHPVSDESLEKIKSDIIGTGKASSVTYRLSGRTINFVITLNAGVSRADGEGLVSHITSNLNDDIKSYYDIQVYYKYADSEDSNSFMGYKQKTSSSFSFTNAG